LDRSLDILFLVAGSAEPLSVSDIASGCGVAESTSYRLVQALQTRGLLRREARKQVTLGPALFDLARAAFAQIGGDLPHLALPLMEDLVRRTGETSFLTVRSALEVVCVESVESSRGVRVAFGKWQIAPLYAGSATALLAHLEEGLIDRVISANEGKRYANGDTVTRGHVRELMARVRAEGHVVTVGEVDPDATGIGAPIFDGRRAVAALSLAGPSSRLKGEALPRLIEEVKQTAREIGARLAGVSEWNDAPEPYEPDSAAEERL
ncbi:MAG: IclR family transcriptional regulator, partial [Thermoleophilia bacterium]